MMMTMMHTYYVCLGVLKPRIHYYVCFFRSVCTYGRFDVIDESFTMCVYDIVREIEFFVVEGRGNVTFVISWQFRGDVTFDMIVQMFV